MKQLLTLLTLCCCVAAQGQKQGITPQWGYTNLAATKQLWGYTNIVPTNSVLIQGWSASPNRQTMLYGLSDDTATVTMDYELSNSWTTIRSEPLHVGTNPPETRDYQVAAVYSNNYVLIVWKGKTNRVDLESVPLELDNLPQRTVTNAVNVVTNLFIQPSPFQYQFINTNMWPRGL